MKYKTKRALIRDSVIRAVLVLLVVLSFIHSRGTDDWTDIAMIFIAVGVPLYVIVEILAKWWFTPRAYTNSSSRTAVHAIRALWIALAAAIVVTFIAIELTS